ncbi:MAG: tRNA (N(6)-L-threonylcarbamoyladenosine(37)-C(2))-methylthiotransferase MtaB [Chloroflexota bacterium]|nr:tRNA (N(6)-L-threonylcarbamoyladenosine(37)-C(2))-methylthiotransferase MtaB [Dehalococcoidia bacterium]MDW8252995.1 tRNA (N(6)-L-threonylcarbamoyladenosine(37)-C(2))-methylthiotransferase MtaB [Chloroflexota bacterium]
MKVFLTALGCKLNQAEVDRFAEQFVDAGYAVVEEARHADLAIVHSCTVTHVADKKSRQAIRQAKRANPAARVIVSGCYAETAAGELAGLPEVDLVVSQRETPRLIELASALGVVPEPLRDGSVPHPFPLPRTRTRAFVKIQDGCNDFCAYCIIPYSRGRVRSVPVDAVIADIERKLERGYREIVLTGVSIGAYGHDQGPKRATTSLSQLIGEILDRTKVERLRITSLEPHDFDPQLLPYFRDERVCPHLHLCLQSGSDATLRRMRRRYDTAEYAAVAAALRAANPRMQLTTDVIVGFPGETDEEFAETLAFVERLGFAALHVFRYSPRAGTRAASFPNQVPEPVKKARSETLMALGERLAAAARAAQPGQRARVLFEEAARLNGQPAWVGLTEQYFRTIVPAREPLDGQIRSVVITGATSTLLVGCLAKEIA